MDGVSATLFNAVVGVLDKRLGKRTVDAEKLNEMIELLAQVERLYESLPRWQKAKRIGVKEQGP